MGIASSSSVLAETCSQTGRTSTPQPRSPAAVSAGTELSITTTSTSDAAQTTAVADRANLEPSATSTVLDAAALIAHAQLLDIARRAGVGAGTVHRHFPTKEALVAEVIAARTTELLDQAATLPADRSPAQAFFAFWALAVEQAHRNTALCDAFTAQQLRIPETLRARFERTLADMLKAAQAAGAVRADLDANDVMALLSASVLADQRRGPGGQPGRLAGIVADALRPSTQRRLEAHVAPDNHASRHVAEAAGFTQADTFTDGDGNEFIRYTRDASGDGAAPFTK